jgi:ABC-type phosphate transport system substrate-binding protein
MMFLNQSLMRFAQTVSIAALTIGAAFVAQPIQKTSAQGVPGVFGFPPSDPNDINTVLIDGAGSSSISSEALLQAWFDVDANGSFQSPLFSYDANGNSVIDANETFNFWDGLGPAPFVDFDGDGFPETAGRFASYTIAGSGNGRRAIAGAGGFIFDFYVSDAIAVTNVDFNDNGVFESNEDIANVNPIDIQVVFPINASGFTARFTELTNATQTGLCDFLAGFVTNYTQLGGPNLAPVLVFPSDTSATTTAVGNLIEPLCGFDGVSAPEFEINGDLNPAFLSFVATNSGGAVQTIGAPQSQGVVSTVISTAGAVTYVDSVFAAAVGFGSPTGDNPFLAAVDDLNVDLNGSGVVGDFLGEAGFSSAANPLGLGYTIAVGSVYFGFYTAGNYPTILEENTAGNLCLFITSGLDFSTLVGNAADNDAIEPFESGRQAAIDIGFAPPTQPGLDPNCGTIFSGFGGGQLLQQVFNPDGSGTVVPGSVLLGANLEPITPGTFNNDLPIFQDVQPEGNSILLRREVRSVHPIKGSAVHGVVRFPRCPKKGDQVRIHVFGGEPIIADGATIPAIMLT